MSDGFIRPRKEALSDSKDKTKLKELAKVAKLKAEGKW